MPRSEVMAILSSEAKISDFGPKLKTTFDMENDNTEF
jgi:ABC-type enterochelin transport system substrate-binding protein